MECIEKCGECWCCQKLTEFFTIKYMYSFIGEDGFLYEEVVMRPMTAKMIAPMFFDMNIAFIQVNGVLYGHDYRRGYWRNNYVGEIEEYLTKEVKGIPYNPLAEFGDEIPF